LDVPELEFYRDLFEEKKGRRIKGCGGQRA
jgi:hypothetical protein